MGMMSTTVPGDIVETLAPLTGATVQMANDARDGILILNPAGPLAAVTINLPDDASSRIGQTRSIYANKAIALVVIAGGTIFNAPVSLALGDGIIFKKVAANTWAKF